LPGGRIYVTKGMLDHLETEAELASVLGHEIAHVDLKHWFERIQYEYAARKIGGEPMGAMAAIGYELLQVGFSETLEYEADRMGTIYAGRARYHPQAGQLVFAGLRQFADGKKDLSETVGEEVADLLGDAFDDYFRTHPGGEGRIDACDRVFRRQGFDLDHTSYYVGRQNYLDLVPKTEKEHAAEWVAGLIYPARR
jgi:predicted Zn-dependent protease